MNVLSQPPPIATGWETDGPLTTAVIVCLEKINTSLKLDELEKYIYCRDFTLDSGSLQI